MDEWRCCWIIGFSLIIVALVDYLFFFTDSCFSLLDEWLFFFWTIGFVCRWLFVFVVGSLSFAFFSWMNGLLLDHWFFFIEYWLFDGLLRYFFFAWMNVFLLDHLSIEYLLLFRIVLVPFSWMNDVCWLDRCLVFLFDCLL